MMSTSDWRRSQARTRLLIAVRRAERQTDAPTPREATGTSLPTSMARRTAPTVHLHRDTDNRATEKTPSASICAQLLSGNTWGHLVGG